jgi:hypothetical protein
MNVQLELVSESGQSLVNAAIAAHNLHVSAYGDRVYCGRVYGYGDLDRRVSLSR